MKNEICGGLEGHKDNGRVPEYEIDPPHFGDNWRKSTSEAKGEQICSNLHKKIVMHAHGVVTEEISCFIENNKDSLQIRCTTCQRFN